MLQNIATFQSLGYGLASVAFFLLTILLITSFKGRLRGGLLAAASTITTAWAAVFALAGRSLTLTTLHVHFLEFAIDAAWIIFLSALLAGAVGSGRHLLIRYGGTGLVIVLAGTGVVFELGIGGEAGSTIAGSVLIFGSILTSLVALVLIEQIYRNAREGQRKGLKYLSLGVGGIFAYDLVLYTNVILSGQISEPLWAARGPAVAICAPLIAVAAQRSPSWSVGIFVSRHVVFYTTTLFGAGIYLTAVGFLGNYLRESGGAWGPVAQVVVTFAAILALFVLLFSDRARRTIRVFINKHFFENKYDYRDEWLRLIGTLTSEEDSLPLKKRSIKALSEILNTQSGTLWLLEAAGAAYTGAATWNTAPAQESVSADAPVIGFLAKTGWIIEASQLQRDPSHYDDIELPELFGNADFIVPLIHRGNLLGLVSLHGRNSNERLNYEDFDLLKAAGQQIASYLAQEMATEKLAEGKQFEAFNRLTAFLMHDLKNVIAQQSLIVDNANKHKGNPEFVDDALATVKGSVQRMKKIIENLQQGTLVHRMQKVEVRKLVEQAVSQCSGREPSPKATIENTPMWVRADPERLQMAIYHVLRNAQDACDASGEIQVDLTASGNQCCIKVSDNGVGMDEQFVRERLFKPFDSTKGSQGMGIGAYQLRETVESSRGSLEIDSQVGTGTTVKITLGLT